MVRAKKRFRILLVLLVSISILTVSLTYLNENKFKDFSLTITDKNDESMSIKWWFNGTDNHYYLFIPGSFDIENAVVTLDYKQPFTINGQTINNKDSFTSYLKEDGEYTVIDARGYEYILDIMVGSDIPVMYIKTETGGLEKIQKSKEYKSKGIMTFVNDNKEVNDFRLEYIKTRGNTTFSAYVKPYTIEFSDDTSIFNDHKSKKIVLLANYFDKTALNNAVALNLARKLNIKNSSETMTIDLYINNEYMGVYTVCEKLVDQGELTIGYELITRINKCDNYFISTYGQLINIEYNDAHKSKTEIEKIYNDFESAVVSSNGYNKDGTYYTDYCDIENLARTYLLNELTGNIDSGTTSFYLGLKNNEFYVICPWDYDFAFGYDEDRYQSNTKNSNIFWTKYNYSDCYNNENELIYNIYYYLWQHEDFVEEVKKIMNEEVYDIVNKQCEKDYGFKKIEKSLVSKMVVDYYYTYEYSYNTASEIENYYNDRIKYLKEKNKNLYKYLNQTNYEIIYENYDKSIELLNNREMIINEYDYYTILKCSTNGFIGWNTSEDGSGDWYYPGDQIYKLNNDLVLYAIIK